jgi:hypothetical protein
MNNDNPAEMSNQDLENDMQQNQAKNATGNQENLSKSSAAEGTLKSPESDEGSKSKISGHSTGIEERDLDDLVHSQTRPEDSQDGSLPDPEAIDDWESNDDDLNKISS